MPPAEVRLLIRNGGELCGVQFDEVAENTIVSAAHGSPYLATLLAHHAALKALDEQRVRVGRPEVLIAIGSATQEIHGRMSGHARAQLKNYATDEKAFILGIVAEASLSSNGQFRMDNLGATAIGADGAQRCDVVVGELMRAHLLVGENLEGEHIHRFSEDGVAIYLWLRSVEMKLRQAERLASSKSTQSPLSRQGAKS